MFLLWCFYYENLYYFLAALIRLIVPQVFVYAFIRSTKYGVPLGPLSISHVRLYKGERVLSNKGERTIVILRCVVYLRNILGSSKFKLIGENQNCLRFS